MKRLHFEYYMQIDYSVPVDRCNYTIKCLPVNTARQSVSNISIELFPKSKYHYGKDGLNNDQIYGVNDESHNMFYFKINGDVDTGYTDYEERENPRLSMIFRHPHGLNVAGSKIRAYHESLDMDHSLNDYDRAISLMHHLHQDFTYEPNVTTVDTSAEEAFELGRGVCQDYSHIFISLLYLEGIPARYITGLIIGEGASHAWVELLYNGKWYGLDPTNDSLVTEDHIKIAVGRDAKDCMINRGIMHGGGNHTQTIRVLVEEIQQ